MAHVSDNKNADEMSDHPPEFVIFLSY
jgi:hypothetical protein